MLTVKYFRSHMHSRGTADRFLYPSVRPSSQCDTRDTGLVYHWCSFTPGFCLY